MSGWIKIHRKMLDNPIVCKDSDYLSVWVYLLLNATHKEHPALFKGKKITLKPGQLITGRKSISDSLCVTESKVQRILSEFENEQQIEQQTSNKNRLISIVLWDKYQMIEQQDEQQMNDKRTTDEQQMNTNKKLRIKELKNKRIKDIKDIVLFLNQKTNKRFSDKTEATQKAINARFDDGYTIDDFKQVITTKANEWLNDSKMNKYLCPDTLFRPGNFEKYLNQGVETDAIHKRSDKNPHGGIDFGF